jgi:hypothetical protein
MNKPLSTWIAAAVAAVFIAWAADAFAGGSYAAQKRYYLRAQTRSWHSAWYDPSLGRPWGLVVPPTAEFQSQYGWGVPSSRTLPIYHQYGRPYPGPGAIPGGQGLMPTPNIPSDTVQFGIHYGRGPW